MKTGGAQPRSYIHPTRLITIKTTIMSVYKEGYHLVSMIEKASKRIYPDACDYGAPVRKGDVLWNEIKQIIEWYGNKETRVVELYSTGTTVKCTIELMDEWTTGREEHFELTYVTTRKDKNMDGYVYVTQVK